jgi:hypothetical protein
MAGDQHAEGEREIRPGQQENNHLGDKQQLDAGIGLV